MKRKTDERWAPVVTALAGLLLWQFVCSAFSIADYIFPSPLTIAQACVEFAAPIAAAAWKTFWVTMPGFAIAIVVGVLLGFLVGSSRLAYAAIYPLLVGFNAVPKAAIVPIPDRLVRDRSGAGHPDRAGDSGIGYLMQTAGSQQRMPLAFAGLVVIGVMAMAMYELFSLIEKRTTGWAHRGTQGD